MLNILVLIHDGMGQKEEIVSFCKKLNCKVFLLTSKCNKENIFVDYCKENNLVYNISKNNFLEFEDVKKVIDATEIKFNACFTTFENYRVFMSRVNRILGVNDISETSLKNLIDKYKLRNSLYSNALSSSDARIVTENFKLDSKIKYFIKPRIGIGSISTKRVFGNLSNEEIKEMKENIKRDSASILYNPQNELICEKYFEGREYSVELLIHNSEVYIFAVHEKKIKECDYTVVEELFISPPRMLKNEELGQLYEFVENVCKVMKLSFGAYHFELKYLDNQKWEIIEVNPRVGGGLINASTKYRIDYIPLLECWILSILSSINKNFLAYLIPALYQCENKNKKDNNITTIIRFYCLEPGKVVHSLSYNKISQSPKFTLIDIEFPYMVPSVKKEYPYICVLWVINEKSKSIMQESLDEFYNYIQINYM